MSKCVLDSINLEKTDNFIATTRKIYGFITKRPVHIYQIMGHYIITDNMYCGHT